MEGSKLVRRNRVRASDVHIARRLTRGNFLTRLWEDMDSRMDYVEAYE